MRYRAPAALLGSIGAAGLLLSGCSARTEVSLSGNAPAQYSHVYITTQEVWFNTSATAGPDDSGWQRFPLSTPATVDLVADEDGTLGTLATNVNLLAGTYSQIRLIPMDSSAALSASASSIGALYNAEADYVDASGTTVQLPLELLNPDKGIGVQGSLKVPIGSVGVGSASTTSGAGGFGIGSGDAQSTTGTADATGIIGGGTTTDTGVTGTTATGTTATGTSATGTTTTIASFTVNVDGNRDLLQFAYGPSAAGASGIMLSSHAGAYDLSQVGGIQGILTLTNLTGYTGISGLPDIQATAETLSTDGTRHEVVLSTPVHSDGTFLLYPLPTNSSTPAYYDVVIHGGGIATIIIKNVELTLGTSTTALTAATITSTDSSIDTTTITPPSLNTVSIGTLIPRYASSYTANITTTPAAPLPAGTQVSFYQTLGGSGEMPYVIESSPIDPFNQVLFTPQTLSACTVDSGTYVASGETINVVSAAPVQKAGGYLVAGSAPNYADGALKPLVTPPASSICSTVVSTTATTTTPAVASVAVPGLALAAGAATGSVVAVVTPAAKYSQSGSGAYQGQLLISHEGALVAQMALDSVLTTAGGGKVAVKVPSGTTSSLYYVSVRVWKTSSPAQTIVRQWYETPIDLRSSTSGSVAVAIK